MSYTAEAVTSNFCIELSLEEFRRLAMMDFLEVVRFPLEEAGAADISYDHHFGPFVFFQAMPEGGQRVADALWKILNP